jgi:general secretion pathway protein G
MQATTVPFTTQLVRRVPHRGQRGISLIEILVVLAIIALISSGVAILALKAWERSQTKAAHADIAELSHALEMYRLEHGRCPKDPQELVTAGIIKRLKADPWGTPYAFACPGEHGEFDLASAGKDQAFDTDDDINSWDLDPKQHADKG